MFDYNTKHAREMRAYFADIHNSGDTIEFAGTEFETTATLSDGTNIIRAILVIADTMTSDEFETMFEDIATAVELGRIGSPFAVIAEEYDIAINGYDIVENADGSAHATPATSRITDTATVTTRHADGTITRTVQTPADVRAVIEKGHATLATMFENGDIVDYVDDIATDELV